MVVYFIFIYFISFLLVKRWTRQRASPTIVFTARPPSGTSLHKDSFGFSSSFKNHCCSDGAVFTTGLFLPASPTSSFQLRWTNDMGQIWQLMNCTSGAAVRCWRKTYYCTHTHTFVCLDKDPRERHWVIFLCLLVWFLLTQIPVTFTPALSASTIKNVFFFL